MEDPNCFALFTLWYIVLTNTIQGIRSHSERRAVELLIFAHEQLHSIWPYELELFY